MSTWHKTEIWDVLQNPENFSPQDGTVGRLWKLHGWGLVGGLQVTGVLLPSLAPTGEPQLLLPISVIPPMG